MDRIAAALGDAARWRIVELLAERPRSVGELAELTGLRQPQATKHLQTLARAGLVTVFPLGQRRVHALEAAPLAALAGRLRELADATGAHAAERDVVARYSASIEADSAVADRDRWADGRSFAFDRLLPAPPDVVWRHWADPDLLASWWVPPSLTVTACTLEPRPGGRVVLGYRDADGEHHSAGRVRVADEPGYLVFDLAVSGPASVTGHYDVEFRADPEGTRLRLGLRITATTVGAVPFVAGIEPGWNQVLDHLTDVLTKGKS
ncbi:metalloregulator ArsR/SmtB family transcription factor [Amycolatopsis sp. NPDC026612]|uniref:metalloregulator ArsR/SmtB family transcription factor n=1 Tax=Amycolatopsis sp. NPDC026612 TaxID=3155466 RepID=UPI0034086322